MTTYSDCLAGVCPCAGSTYPGADHQCPGDPRSYEEIELETERQLNRPYELDEGIDPFARPVHLDGL